MAGRPRSRRRAGRLRHHRVGGFPIGEADGPKLRSSWGEGRRCGGACACAARPGHGSHAVPDRQRAREGRAGWCQRLADHRPAPIIDDAVAGLRRRLRARPALTEPLKEPEGFNEMCAPAPPRSADRLLVHPHDDRPDDDQRREQAQHHPRARSAHARRAHAAGPRRAEEVWAQIQDALGALAANVDFVPGAGCPPPRHRPAPAVGLDGAHRPAVLRGQQADAAAHAAAPPTPASGARSWGRSAGLRPVQPADEPRADGHHGPR